MATDTSHADNYADSGETGTDTAPCRKCERHIPTNVETCPECEFNYSNSVVGTGMSFCMIGGLLTILVITAIIGIPMVLIGIWLVISGLLTSKPAADVEGDGAGSTKPWYLKSFPQLYREWRS